MPSVHGDHPLLGAVWPASDRGLLPTVAAAVHATVAAGAAVIDAVVGHRRSRATAVRAPAARAFAASHEKPQRRITAESETLIYELLDAHSDTVHLAAELRSELRWAAHLDYLRALQRTGRQTLAHMSVED